MLVLLDTLVAAAGAVLGLSLIVQALQQIAKQVLDLESACMRVQLLALFGRPAPLPSWFSRLVPLPRPATARADPSAAAIVRKLDERLASSGHRGLHLLASLDGREVADLVSDVLREAPAAARADAVERAARWFDLACDAFHDLYRRRMRAWALALSAVVVVSVNADLFRLVRDFGEDRAMRDAAVAAAPGLLTIAQREPAPGPAHPPSPEQAAAAIAAQVRTLQALLASKAVPMARWGAPDDPLGSWTDAWQAARRHGPGWIAMILLVSLGAPFWYDVLKSLLAFKTQMVARARSLRRDGRRHPERATC